MIAIRNNHVSLGRGALRFLYPDNRKVLAWIREHDNERVLCVANLSRAPQAVQLDLSDLRTAVPVELTGGTSFPPIGDLPYLLTMPAYGFYWFSLSTANAGTMGPSPEAPELFTLVLTGGVETLMKGRERQAFERTVAPRFIGSRRWFGAKGSRIRGVEVVDSAILPRLEGSNGFLLPRIAVSLANGETQEYFVPLAVDEGREDESLMDHAVARVRRGPRMGLLYGAASSPDFALAMVDAIRHNREIASEKGSIRFTATSAFDPELELDPADIRRLSAEQSNTSIAFGSRAMLKLLRRLQPGSHPEVEVGRFLTEEAGFKNTPALLGVIEHVGPDGTATALGLLQAFVRNQGDAWTLMLEYLRRDLDAIVLVPESEAHSPEETFATHLRWAGLLGQRTAEMHRALASETADRPSPPSRSRPTTSRRSPPIRGARPRRPCGPATRSAPRRRREPARRPARSSPPRRRSRRWSRRSAARRRRGPTAPGSTATTISARCSPRRTTSSSSISRASRRGRWTSAGRSRRRCATSPASCAPSPMAARP